MTAAPVQTSIAEVEKDARAKELEGLGDVHAVVLEQLFAACKRVVREHTAEEIADEMDVMWANRGRPVTGPILRSALGDSRGNYFRLEWILYFAERSAEVRELLLGIALGRGPKDPADELGDLHEILRDEFPKQADRLIQKAKAPRAPRKARTR